MSTPEIGSPDTGTRYYANRGKVYADDHTEAATARSANGRELERHDRALQDARQQREELERVARLAEPMRVELVKPARSHWLELERGSGLDVEPFSKEEVHPIVRVHFVPRVGTVLADVSADRYVASTPDGPKMGAWRIVLRRVRADAEEAPELYTSPEVSGVGPKTRPAISAAAESAVRSWLEGTEYEQSRRHAATSAIVRQIKDAAGRGSYAFDSVRRELDAVAPHLAEWQVSTLKTSAERIAGALEELEKIGNE